MNVKENITRGRGRVMEEIRQQRYCENCKKETVHVVREDAIEIEYICNECNQQQEIVKNFF